jgi:hypothetical protein
MEPVPPGAHDLDPGFSTGGWVRRLPGAAGWAGRSLQNRESVAQQVGAFIDRYAPLGNRIGLASRPRGYESVADLLRPAGLALAEVNPLGLDGICQLIDNLLALIEPDARLRAQDREGLERAIRRTDELVRLAGIPLFCSALVQVYKYHGAELPQRRVDVRLIVDLLLGSGAPSSATWSTRPAWPRMTAPAKSMRTCAKRWPSSSAA